MFTMNNHEALLKAVRHTDISLFGPLFDFNYFKLEPSLSAEERRAQALSQTLTSPVIARVGVRAIQTAIIEGSCGSKYFSPESREQLEKYIQQHARD